MEINFTLPFPDFFDFQFFSQLFLISSRVMIGFMAEELPEFLRRGDGYDLKALVAILALKVSKLEEELSKLKTG